MHAYVHKYAEVDDVAHGAHKLHSGLEILYVQHILAQKDGGQLVARVAAGLEELSDDIVEASARRRRTPPRPLPRPWPSRGREARPGTGGVVKRV